MSRDHEVDLVSFVERSMTLDERGRLGQLCRRIEEVVLPRSHSVLRAAAGLLSARPLQVHYYGDPRFADLVRTMSRERRYDLVFSHLFRVFPYAILVEGAYRLLDLTDVISREVTDSARFRRIPMRWLYRLEGARIRRFEREACLDAHETWVISRAEMEELKRTAVAENVRVIPNGLCRELIGPSAAEPEPGRLGFLGHLEVFHNVDGLRYFIESVFPTIRSRVPEARLVIGGVGGSPLLSELARREGVSVQGYVPDLAEFLRRCAVFIAPLRFAAGTQNKVIQAMAAGVPVLVSPHVARGIDAEPDKELIVAFSDAEWVDKAIELLHDPLRARSVGEAGRRFALGSYDWEAARARIRSIEIERGVASERRGFAG
jgi:glycosyltransferase involved in cell wall biosynthesis